MAQLKPPHTPLILKGWFNRDTSQYWIKIRKSWIITLSIGAPHDRYLNNGINGRYVIELNPATMKSWEALSLRPMNGNLNHIKVVIRKSILMSNQGSNQQVSYLNTLTIHLPQPHKNPFTSSFAFSSANSGLVNSYPLVVLP